MNKLYVGRARGVVGMHIHSNGRPPVFHRGWFKAIAWGFLFALLAVELLAFMAIR
jgi:hypothetical protein